jgi:uncharacterized protein YdaU (DUF1376 family)
MAKPDVWMPLYVADYLADTMRLSTAEHGAYLLLVMAYWQHGPLPDDDAKLADFVRVHKGAWRKLRPAVEYLFEITDGVWRHSKLDLELAKAEAAMGRPHWSLKLSLAQRSAMKAARRARKRQAVPSWLTAEDRRELTVIYAEAQKLTVETAIKHEVDHIVPLAGQSVCGLHVPWNLQVLRKHENRAKGNAVLQ